MVEKGYHSAQLCQGMELFLKPQAWHQKLHLLASSRQTPARAVGT